jgi:hypothetical protein
MRSPMRSRLGWGSDILERDPCETFVRSFHFVFAICPFWFCYILPSFVFSRLFFLVALPLASFGMYVCMFVFRLRRVYPTAILNFNNFVCYSFFFLSRFSQCEARPGEGTGA